MVRFVCLFPMVAAGLGGLRAEEVTVFAAASLSDALNDLKPHYEQASGHRLRFNFAGSGTLARQIREGAPADVFLSADDLRVDQLRDAQMIVEATRHRFAANTLVLVVAAGEDAPVAAWSDLATPAAGRIAIGEPASVPAGAYARAHLQRMGLWHALSDKLVPRDNVRAVLAAVEAGNVDAGIVYRTDALHSPRIRVVAHVPPTEEPGITYTVVVLRAARSPAAARAFGEFLLTVEAQAVFARRGFLNQ